MALTNADRLNAVMLALMRHSVFTIRETAPSAMFTVTLTMQELENFLPDMNGAFYTIVAA